MIATKIFKSNTHSSHEWESVRNLRHLIAMQYRESTAYRSTLVYLYDSPPSPNELKSSIDDFEQFIFHIYGNYVLNQNAWNEIWKLLEDKHCKVVVLSRFMQFQLKCLGFDNTYIYHPFQSPKFRSSKDKYFDQFIYAGRISPDKRILELFDAFSSSKLSHKKLCIVGPLVSHKLIGQSDKNFFEEFKKRIQFNNLKSDSNITYLPAVNNAQIKGLLNQHDIFISFSNFLLEDFGLAAWEAAQLGLPAVLSRWGGHLDHPNCKLINKADISKTGKISNILSNLKASDFEKSNLYCSKLDSILKSNDMTSFGYRNVLNKKEFLNECFNQFQS